jgi:branched-chain amino acid transport system permease protein
LGEAWVNERGWRLMDFIAPESFTYWLSIVFLVGSVFGGMTSVWGAVAGGLLLQFWPDIAGMVSRDLVHPVFGALLVLSTRFMPNGVAGAMSVWRWLATWATRARL